VNGEESTPAPRRRNRQNSRQRVRAVHPASATYITRQMPPYEPLDEDRLIQVERHADLLLQEIGMEIRGDADALRLWRDAGATIRDECRVHVPAGLARQLVTDRAPQEFVQHARNPARSVRIGGTSTVLAPAYGSPFVSDAEKGRRYGTIEDFQNFVRLAYLTPWLHHSGGTGGAPVDLPG
jgi:trimethylamine--corrinoid protein Co-methyltransferase